MRIILSLIYAPIVFFSLRYLDTPLENALVLKAFPLVLSISITAMMILSYIKKESMILVFARRFSKEEIDKEEIEYIHKSTLFWIIICTVNILFHTIILFDTNSTIWIFYSTIGWYFLFGIAGILQFLHKKFIFSKRLEIED
ncbi:MAG: hypothetical protein DRG78_07995 [Epsilonproteobacteria bacterium]|nr:MAG: hypothetical protein DRG78_07995 [Campylobacterota bacterium]